MTTMNKIAELAGVSQATVSRVVNGSGHVSENVAESVRQAIRKLRYQPRGRGKATKSANEGPCPNGGVIALVMLDDSMDCHPTLALAKLRGVETAAASEGLTVAVVRQRSGKDLPAALRRQDLLGMLLWGERADARLLRRLQPIPSLWLSSHADAEDQVILVGNEEAGRLAAEYLLHRGVRHPAFFCPLTRQKQCQLRGNGFHYAYHLAGIHSQTISADSPDSQSFEDLDYGGQAGLVEQLVARLLDRRPMVDGVFIPDDQITCLAYAAMARKGVRPGVDVAIVSCGNEPVYLRGLTPRPPTIDLAPETTGRLAVEQLMRMIRHPDACERTTVLVRPRLVPGDGPQPEARTDGDIGSVEFPGG